MTLANWCLLIAILMPYGFTFFAKFHGDFGPRQNHNPRDFLAQLEGARKRAHWAQLNSFEILPGFVAAVLVAEFVANAGQATINTLAVIFIISRICYGFCYITDRATVRSALWFIGLLSIVALFVVSI